MTVIYACTHVEKDAEEDRYETGADPSTRTGIICQSENITAPSLPDLVKKLEDRYFLEFDEGLMVREDGNLSFSRLETNDCDTPTDDELAEWRKGELKLYLCDYYFVVEKRVVTDVDPKEYAEAGVLHQDAWGKVHNAVKPVVVEGGGQP